jgi:hypothetical protein
MAHFVIVWLLATFTLEAVNRPSFYKVFSRLAAILMR